MRNNREEPPLHSLLRASLDDVGSDVGTILRRLEAGEGHLGLGDVLLGVLKVVVQRVGRPRHTSVLVGGRVLVVGHTAGLASNEAIQVGSLLVTATLWCVDRGSLVTCFVLVSVLHGSVSQQQLKRLTDRKRKEKNS